MQESSPEFMTQAIDIQYSYGCCTNRWDFRQLNILQAVCKCDMVVYRRLLHGLEDLNSVHKHIIVVLLY